MRMWRYIENELPGGVPEELFFYNEERAWRIYSRWKATGGRFLPSQLLAEDQQDLDDLMTMIGLDAIVENLINEQKE